MRFFYLLQVHFGSRLNKLYRILFHFLGKNLYAVQILFRRTAAVVSYSPKAKEKVIFFTQLGVLLYFFSRFAFSGVISAVYTHRRNLRTVVSYPYKLI